MLIIIIKIICYRFSNLFVHKWLGVIITLMLYRLLMGLINLARAISNRTCCNSSVFPSYVKFLTWHRLMAFSGSWKSSTEKYLFPILLYITLFILQFSHLYSHYFQSCILSFKWATDSIGNLTLRAEVSRNFQDWEERVYIGIFRRFLQPERIQRWFNKIV